MIKDNFSCERDGMTIRGLVFRPEGVSLPIAILCHGFMGSYTQMEDYADWFAGQGYAAFCFDFNGGGPVCRSDPDTTKMTIFTETEDLRAVITFAQSCPFTDEGRVTLMGCSQGGVVAALAAAQLREQIDKLVLFYPALCIPDDARAGQMMFARFDPDHIPEVIDCGSMKIGRSYAADVQGIELIDMIRAYTGKTLIVHGTADDIVDYHYSEKAYAAYADAQLKLISDAGHGFEGDDDRQALAYVRAFLVEK